MKLLEAFFASIISPTESNKTVENDNIWRANNPFKSIHFVAKKFANVRRDVIKNKRLTDIELDAIEARVTLANLVGFDDDTAEAHDEKTPPQKTTTKKTMLQPP